MHPGLRRPGLRVAFTAGHCHGDGPVLDRDNKVIGNRRDVPGQHPQRRFVNTDQQIADYESIVLAPDVAANNILPGGRVLQSDPGLVVTPGEPVCHFGVVTGESCGTVESVNNGWFTMGHGAVSQQGDSGGPVYITSAAGPAPHRRDLQQRLGQFPGGGVVAVHHPADPRGRRRRRPGDLVVRPSAVSTNTGIDGAAARNCSSLGIGCQIRRCGP